MALYQLDDIIHRYKDQPVLSIEAWTINEGMITGLCGPNGSGKSTLLKLLGLIERPSRGEIRFNGHKADPFAQGMRDRVTLLPQDSYLLKRSVYNNVAYGLHIRRVKRNVAERVQEALNLVGLAPERFAQRPWYALSGGEARRVALASRLVLRPKALLLDEPTTSVDAASALLMKEAALHAHREWGASLIISSHDVQWLQDISHDIIYLFNGRILGKGQRTLIFGPWLRLSEDRVGKRLADGQVFVADNPSFDGSAVAAIDPARLKLHLTDREMREGRNLLKGMLTSLGLEKISGAIGLSVAVGEIEFTAYLSPDTLSTGDYRPGMEIWISYRPEEVKWY